MHSKTTTGCEVEDIMTTIASVKLLRMLSSALVPQVTLTPAAGSQAPLRAISTTALL